MKLRLNSWLERGRTSLFLLPTTAVFAAIAAGLATVALDRRLDSSQVEFLGLPSTVDSARALLGTVAGATISFAGVAFSISLLVVQLTSTQYSSRLVNTVFRDPFNRRVMATVVGTFTYCLVVLRSVRSPLEAGGDPVIPNVSVVIALVLGIASILAVVALIDHNAHVMDVSQILDRVTSDALVQVSREWRSADGAHAESDPAVVDLAGATTITFDRSGWVQQLDIDDLLAAAPRGSSISISTYPGRFAVAGTELCRVSGPVDDADDVARRVRAAVAIGSTRTMQQDAGHGLRQVVDVALRALSPGVNDPTTAQDAIFHGAVILAAMVSRRPPASVLPRDGGGWLVLSDAPTHEDVVELAYDEVRHVAAGDATVSGYLLEAIRLVREVAGEGSAADRALAEQARLVVEGCEASGLLPHDLARVQRSFAAKFPLDP